MPTPPQKKVTFPIKILDFLLVFLVYILEGGWAKGGGTPSRDPPGPPLEPETGPKTRFLVGGLPVDLPPATVERKNRSPGA